jgi:hypothetical protein
MANLTNQQIKDSYQSVLTTSETSTNPTTGTLQNGKGTAITTLTVSGTVNATTLGGTLSTASQPNVTSVGTLTSLTSSGTVTATKLVPTGNVTAGNGMYLPATNTLALGTNGAERVRIDASGNVGIGGVANPQSMLHVVNTANTLFQLNGNNTTAALDTGFTISADDLKNIYLYQRENAAAIFGTNNAERMRIDASGNVGIGATSPVSKLHVRGSAVDLRIDDTQAYNFGTSGPQLLFTGLDSASTLTLFGSIVGTPQNGNPDRGYLNIRTRVEGVTTQTLQIGTGFSADVIVNTGNLGVGVEPTSRNNTRLQIVDGIGFPATQVASSDPNTLDDYEEGTFDAIIEFNGASAGVTYSERQCSYTKIGRLVHVSGFIILTSKGSSTGDATIAGLPFLVSNQNGGRGGVSIGYFNNITFADFPQGYTSINNTVIALVETTNAGVLSSITNADFTNDSQIMFTATYIS